MSQGGFKIAKTVTGKYVVHYLCPSCKEALKNPIDDAGCLDTCPQCQTSFVVPGTEKKQQLEAERQKEEAATLALEEKEAREREVQTQAARVAKQQAKEKKSPSGLRFGATANSNADADGELKYPSIEIKIRPTFQEATTFVAAVVLFISMKIYIVAGFFSGAGRRFQDDNAIGATANALEKGNLLLIGEINVCAAFLLLILWKLHQLTRIQALHGMQIRLK